ncbi:MAG: DNA recombination protein RmuC [Gammaproteobacteria bacterium]
MNEILMMLVEIIIVCLIIGFFLNWKLKERDDSAQALKAEDEQKKKDDQENMINALSKTFGEIARKSQEDIRKTSDDQRKIDQEGKTALNELVFELNKNVNEAAKKWDTDTKAITADLRNLATSHTQWAEALTNPGNQGGMAEESLQMLLEAAGFDDGTHFKMQPREVNEDGNTLIPDCYIFLPDDGVIVIDSKAPMTHYKRAFEASDSDEKAKHLKEHAKSYITYAKNLKDKDYTSAVNRRTPDHIFMFVPNAAVYLAAVDSIPDLDQRVRHYGVSIVPPQMLYAALKTVWLTWKEKQVNENMEEVQKLVYEFQERANKFYGGSFADIGKSIESLNKIWNKSLRSYKRRLGPTLNKVEKKIGIEEKEKTKSPQLIDEVIESPDD